ncbi:MAG: SDR family NAD(P)-dependent oxidoreductase [Solirubrobacterales bacterium]|nr:SDR family NAD(P)-dependent oxidoreductase [Solirubrobacterales bacterium]
MKASLTGKTVLITGATGGIGAATSRELIGRGANVVVTDIGLEQVTDLATELGERALPIVVDVTDRGSIDQAVAQAVAHFGKVDIVFANAGIANDPPLTVAGLTDEMYEKVIDVDLNGVWHTVRAGLPQVIENGGYVLITSSIYAFMNGVVNAPYAMSKAAVEQLGRALRTELAYRGASAGVLYPGWVDTNIAKIAMHDPGPVKELADHAFRGPLGKTITPERAAKAIANGMEKHSARIIVPRRWVPFSMLRGVFNMATDALMQRDAKVAGVLERIDRDAPGA